MKMGSIRTPAASGRLTRLRLALLASLTAAAITGAAIPAEAKLQLAIQAGATSYFCADNNPACDTNPAIGILDIANQTIGGLTINGSIQTSEQGAIDFLNSSSLSIINMSGASVNAAVVIGDTDFVGPVNSISLSGSGVYQTAKGSNITMQWYADTANNQGADNSTDLPGTMLDSFTFLSTHLTDSFSHSNEVTFWASGPFSMTETAFGTLVNKGSLLNRGQTEVAEVIPEPATWAMMGLGFAGLGYVGSRRARVVRTIGA